MLAQLAQIAREAKPKKVLVGTEENDALVSRGGASVLSAGQGDDVYVFHRDSKMFVTIDDGALLSSHVYLSGGGRDTLFFADINLEDLSYERKGNDLLIAHADDAKSQDCGVLIHAFYGEPNPHYAPAETVTDESADSPELSQNRIESVLTADFQLVDLGLL